MSKPIFVPLTKEPFLKFERGTKTYEIRQAGSPVAKQVCRFDTGGGHPVILSLGYSGRRLHGELGTRYFADRFAGLMTEVRAKADVGDVSGFFDAGRPVVAFQVRNIRPAGSPVTAYECVQCPGEAFNYTPGTCRRCDEPLVPMGASR